MAFGEVLCSSIAYLEVEKILIESVERLKFLFFRRVLRMNHQLKRRATINDFMHNDTQRPDIVLITMFSQTNEFRWHVTECSKNRVMKF